jgi:RNA polymerase sigma factor (sigma-70 family)
LAPVVGSGVLGACVRGEPGSWEQLVRTNAPLVWTVIRRCGFDGEAAADIFQDVWIQAWDGLAGVREERLLPAWLATIAARTAKREIGRIVRRPVVPIDGGVLEEPDDHAGPEEQALVGEEARAVRLAVQRLPERDRVLIESFFYDTEPPTYDTIAARLGVAPSTIGPLRVRALKRLRRALADAGVN